MIARHVVTISLLLVATIHLLPVAGVLGGEQLIRLYGISVSDPNLEIMLRHRAALFGIIAALLIAAAFKPLLRAAALWVAAASVVSFLGLAWSVGGYNSPLGRVVVADLVALVLLGAALIAMRRQLHAADDVHAAQENQGPDKSGP